MPQATAVRELLRHEQLREMFGYMSSKLKDIQCSKLNKIWTAPDGCVDREREKIEVDGSGLIAEEILSDRYNASENMDPMGGTLCRKHSSWIHGCT